MNLTTREVAADAPFAAVTRSALSGGEVGGYGAVGPGNGDGSWREGRTKRKGRGGRERARERPGDPAPRGDAATKAPSEFTHYLVDRQGVHRGNRLFRARAPAPVVSFDGFS